MPFFLILIPWVLVFLFGACLFSFLNVVSWRLPRKRSFVSERSACPACGHVLAARDLVPVLSWLLLRGRCRYCCARISPRYPLMELLGGAFAMLSAALCGFSLRAVLLFAGLSAAVLLLMLAREKRLLARK